MAEESARLEQIVQDLERQIKRNELDLHKYEQVWQVERDRLLPQIEQLKQEALSNQRIKEEYEEKERTYFANQVELRAKAQKEQNWLEAEANRLQEERATYVKQQNRIYDQWRNATEELEEVRAMSWWKRTFSSWRTYDEAAQQAHIHEYHQQWVEEGQKIEKVDGALKVNRLRQREVKDSMQQVRK